MTENVVQSSQKLIQDVIAPDVRELKVELAPLKERRDSALTLSKSRARSSTKVFLRRPSLRHPSGFLALPYHPSEFRAFDRTLGSFPPPENR